MHRDVIAGGFRDFDQLLLRLRNLHFPSEDSTNFISCSKHTEAVRTVRRKIKVKNFIIQTEHGVNWNPNFSIFRKNENTFLLLFRYELLIQAEFLGRADHPLGGNTAQLRFLDLKSTRKLGAYQSNRYLLTGVHILRSAYDLKVLTESRINNTHIKFICIGVLFLTLHITHYDLAYARASLLHRINFYTGTCNLLSQFLRDYIFQRYIIRQPFG
ncbi:hypothetical protein D3C81_1313860 [compost metagenome]